MLITIKYYPDANDEMDAEALVPKRLAVCHSIAEAEAALGLIERHEKPAIITEDVNF